MPTDLAPADPLIDALVADLGAVRPRRWPREAALIAGLAAVELALFLAWRGARPDLDVAMVTPAFWWKLGSLAAIGTLATVAALVSLDPASSSTGRLGLLWRLLGIALPASLALGWLLDAGSAGRGAMIERLAWRDGLDCMVSVALLAVPVVVTLGLVLRRGATVQPGRTATAAGLAAAGLAAFVFAFSCDHDDPLYVAVWYGAALVGIAGLTRGLLPRLLRW